MGCTPLISSKGLQTTPGCFYWWFPASCCGSHGVSPPQAAAPWCEKHVEMCQTLSNLGTLWLCQNSYWKCWFIVDFPIKKWWFSIAFCMFTRGYLRIKHGRRHTFQLFEPCFLSTRQCCDSAGEWGLPVGPQTLICLQDVLSRKKRHLNTGVSCTWAP